MLALSVDSDYSSKSTDSFSPLEKIAGKREFPKERSKESSKETSSSSMENTSSYDENDVENYFEDRQVVYNGEQEHPEFTNHHVMSRSSKHKEKSLKPILKKYGFPPIIITKADEVFSQMDYGLKRGVRTRQIMFFCVQTAYNQLGIPEDPARLATLCGLTSSEMIKSFSMCSPSKTKFKAAPVHWSPKDFIRVYYQKIVDMELISFSDETLIEIDSICNDVMSKSRELHDEKPQTVAAAIIVFYLSLHGCSIDKKKYTEVFSKSQMTICKLQGKVAQLYNS